MVGYRSSFPAGLLVSGRRLGPNCAWPGPPRAWVNDVCPAAYYVALGGRMGRGHRRIRAGGVPSKAGLHAIAIRVLALAIWQVV